ncbi:MFS transporter [Actinomadura logoneensis]|uniref:MFS transporter n=1 Tax=Actinomadura logoneensis TaxID=2293572 RepID=A0A372JCB1_9ACTN|nr:MFS transporter [Actinomadura logoneensis]RFU37651.1 MFS transporter [Actinomadura logoneensis]
MGYLKLLRDGNVALLWSAQTLSVLGDRMYALAVMWLAWETSHSALLMGAVSVAESLPYLLVGLAGRRLVTWTAGFGRLAAVDAARTLVVAALPVLWTVSGPSTAALLAVAALLGLLGAVFEPCLASLAVDLVPADQVRQVSGLMDLMRRTAQITGPGAAALLLLVLPEVRLYALDAATFAVSVVALAVLARRVPATRTIPTPGVAPTRPPRARELLRGRPVTTWMIALHGVGQLLYGITLAVPALLAVRLGGAATGSVYAWTAAATGVGAVAANLLAGNLRGAGRVPGGYCAAWAAQGVLLAALGAAWTMPQFIVVSVAFGAASPVAAIGLRTHLSRFASEERVGLMTADQTWVRTAGTAGTLLMPALAEGGPEAAFGAAGAGMGLVSVLVWAVARGRSHEGLEGG